MRIKISMYNGLFALARIEQCAESKTYTVIKILFSLPLPIMQFLGYIRHDLNALGSHMSFVDAFPFCGAADEWLQMRAGLSRRRRRPPSSSDAQSPISIKGSTTLWWVILALEFSRHSS
jgi:hypothetical protein